MSHFVPQICFFLNLVPKNTEKGYIYNFNTLKDYNENDYLPFFAIKNEKQESSFGN